jgi:hypothetical protein
MTILFLKVVAFAVLVFLGLLVADWAVTLI